MNEHNRAIRKPGGRPKPAKRGRGLAFFLSTLAILAFTVLYSFTDVLPKRFGQLPHDGEIYVSFIDVGQGDSILIRAKDNAVLIDGGEARSREAVMTYLREAGVARLCMVVISHPHSDHIGSLPVILSSVDVGLVAMPDVEHPTASFENLLEAILNNDLEVVFPLSGDSLVAGIINLEVVSPQEFSEDINNSSIVLRLVHGNTAFLFTGDAERQAEELMMQSVSIRADVLKVGHHGSRTSTSQEFLETVNPSIAVISLGTGNRFGHPHPDVIGRLEKFGAEILRTDIHGNITMVTDGREIGVYVDR